MEENGDPQLLRLSDRLLAAEQSPWQPRMVARAWATRGPEEITFTFQHWIDLDAVHSPLLLGEPPTPGPDLEAAFRVFGLDLDGASGTEIALIVEAMLEAIEEAWASRIAMEPPEDDAPGEDQGFGDWLPYVAALTAQARAGDWEVVLRMPAAAGLQLLAGHKNNRGWTVMGKTYAMQDLRGGRRHE